MALDQISQAYQDLLGRAPEQAGLDYWTNALNSGTSIDQIRQQFTQTPEYQQRQQQLNQPAPQQPAPTFTSPQQPAAQVNPYAGQINQFFQTSLNRAPEQAGLDYWTNQITSGTMTPEQVQQAIASSPEAQARSTVTNAFQNYLGRAPEQAGSEYWTNQITSGAMTPQQVAQAIRQSDEGQKYAATPNQAPSDYQNTVNNAFNTYLGRTPEQEGLNYWTDQLVSGALTPEQATAAIKNSQESQARTAVTDAFNTYLGRTPQKEGLDYWTQQIVSGAMTPEQAAAAIKTSDEGDIYNAPQTVKDAYTKWLGRDPEQEGLDYWINQIKTGALTPEEVVASIQGSEEGSTRNAINDIYKQYLGRDAELEGLNYWVGKLDSGDNSWNSIRNAIIGSEEANKYRQANPVNYFGDIYARDEQGNLIRNQETDEYGNAVDGNSYQKGNYGFDTGMRAGENWDQYQNRVNGYYADSVSKMYQTMLGRAPTAEELRNIEQSGGENWWGGSGWQNVNLQDIQKNLALSPEAQKYAAQNGTWLTLTHNQTVQKQTPWGTYETTEPTNKSVYIPPSVAGLTEAMQDIYKSDNPQALVDQITADPNAYMKQKLESLAWTAGWNGRVATDHRSEASKAWDLRGSNEFNPNAVMQDLATKANDTAKWLLDNKAMTQEELANLWKSKGEEAANTVQRGVLDQIHEDGGGFWSGEWLGDFLEKYEVPIMTAILGGAVLGPLAGAAAEFGGGAALAGATGTGAALPAVSTLAGYSALAGTAGATSTAVALASGAPTNKALLAGGLAAAGVGLGGALGPSGLNVAGTLTAAGMPPVLSAVTVGALSGGALGALSGAASGNLGEGALSGALAGGISSGVNTATKTFNGLTGTLTRLAAGTAVGALAGKDISAAFQAAAVGTVVGLATSGAAKAIKDAASGSTDIKSQSYTPNDADVAELRSAMTNQLVKQLGEDQLGSIQEYVDSLPTSAFKSALSAVDGEVVKAVGEAAAYPQEAVKQLYKDNLGREPDAAGLKYWTDALRNGTPLDQIQSSIKASTEATNWRNNSYAANNTGTMTDASGVSNEPKNLNEDYETTKPIDIDVTYPDKTETSGGQFGQDDTSTPTQSPDWYRSSIDKIQNYLKNGVDLATGAPLTQERIAQANTMLADYQGKLSTLIGSDLQTATPEKLQDPSIWDDIAKYGASVFTFGTPGGGGVAITGSGASGNKAGAKYSMFAFDGNQQKQTMIVKLQEAADNPNLTPEQKATAEKVLEEAKKTEVKNTKTTGGEKPGSQTLENNQTTGGQTGGGGDSTSKAPSGRPGADAASLGAQAAVEYQAITNKTVTSKQVTDMLNPSSAAAQAASAIVPGSLSIAKIQSDVNVMFQTFLGRNPEKAGLDYWSNKIKSGEMTIAQVASAIANSEEGKAKAASGSGSSSTATSDTGAGTKNTTTDTGTTTAGTGTGTAGTGTNTGTNGTGTGTGGGTGGGSGTGSGTGTGAGTDGTGTGTGTGSSTGSGTGGSGTGTGSGTGSGSGSGGSGGGTGGGSGTGTNIAQYLQQPSLFGLPKGHDIAADVIGGGTKIDLGGRFEAPMLTATNYAPINYVPPGGLMMATGGLVDDGEDQSISADTAGVDSDADIFSGGTAEIDLGGVFKGQPQTYPSQQQQRGYAEGGHVPEFYSEGGLSNRYVNGAGDGTSDDVPAMLATGEFVIPADVVAALGNGSNDAGANVLDELLQVIRQHKQAHDPKELPPDSLGPLAYLNKAMKKAGK